MTDNLTDYELRLLRHYAGRSLPTDAPIIAGAAVNTGTTYLQRNGYLDASGGLTELGRRQIEPNALETSRQKTKTSAGRWAGVSVIYGKEDDHATPYMTRAWIGRLRVHAFHRGDQDPDCHDHPWDFWTFPLQPYVEEVAIPTGKIVSEQADGQTLTESRWESTYHTHRQVVPAWRWTFRPAEHTHRVVGRHDGVWPALASDLKTKPGTILTIVWRGRARRKWGFLKERAGRWCRVFWRDYVYGNGKSAPCE